MWCAWWIMGGEFSHGELQLALLCGDRMGDRWSMRIYGGGTPLVASSVRCISDYFLAGVGVWRVGAPGPTRVPGRAGASGARAPSVLHPPPPPPPAPPLCCVRCVISPLSWPCEFFPCVHNIAGTQLRCPHGLYDISYKVRYHAFFSTTSYPPPRFEMYRHNHQRQPVSR
jgi:hypothetical protein